VTTPYEELIGFVESNGIARYEAEHAVRRCAMAIALRGAATYAGGGFIMYFMNMNPASAIGYGAMSFGVGAAYGLAKAPQCREVREAIRFWNTAPI
jgi:hypothetical protein